MKPLTLPTAVAALTAALGLPGLVHGQSNPPAGVVTAVSGAAVVARASLGDPAPLRFRDDVYVSDVIRTREKSLVRVLLGGKAVVTIRELSAVRITEQAGHSTIDLTSGKVALSVVKSRMRPGDSIDVRTVNAIAAVRGTVLVVDVQDAAGGAAGDVTTTVHVLTGLVEVTPRGATTGSVMVGARQAVSVTGATPGPVRDVSSAGIAHVTSDLGLAPSQMYTPSTTSDAVVTSQVSEARTVLETAEDPRSEPTGPGGSFSPAVSAVTSTVAQSPGTLGTASGTLGGTLGTASSSAVGGVTSTATGLLGTTTNLLGTTTTNLLGTTTQTVCGTGLLCPQR